MSNIYVSTYAKYNAGNLAGQWIDPSDYSDKDDFITACLDLHKDESDPELMFQDYQGIPSGMVSESHVKPELWDWLELDGDDQKLLAVYRDYVNEDADIEDAREAHRGTYDSPKDYAEEFHEECGDLASVPDSLKYHIDWESVARDMGHSGVNFVDHDGKTWVFID